MSQDNTTRRQRDQARAYAHGYDAFREYRESATCHYRRPWLRGAWRTGRLAAIRATVRNAAMMP